MGSSLKPIKYWFFCLVFSFPPWSFSDTDSDLCFENLQEYLRDENDAFKEYGIMNEEEFKNYREREKEQYEKFRSDIKTLWGEFLESSRKCWVHYGEDMQSVGVVDFERGVVRVDVIGKEEDALNSLSARLSYAVKSIITSTQPAEGLPENEPILHGQVSIPGGEGDSALEEFAGKIVEKANVEVAPERKKISVEFPLVSDHLRRRAKKYYSIIHKYCEKYDLSISHVMATVHAESYFNPLARSSGNAYGLMQLVPETGGRDAFRFVYGRDGVPTPDLLYNPEKNIELGCAYIYLLKSRHFGDVTNELNNLYCSIAGFNTGPGNVAAAFTGKKELSGAVKIINGFKNPDYVYAHLLDKLPFYETRAYLKNVVDLMRVYR